MEKYIYYSGQRDWTSDDYDYLNSFLNKIFLYRDKDVNKYRISHMNLAAMENTTKAIIKAILMQQEILDEVVRENRYLRSYIYKLILVICLMPMKK